MSEPAEKIQLGVIGLGSFTIGIELAALREVVKLEQTFTIPGSAPCIVGGFHLRGENIPLLDLRYLLDEVESPREMSSVAIIVSQGLTLGILCDTANDVLNINAEACCTMAYAESGHELLTRGFHFNNLQHAEKMAHPLLADHYIYLLDVEVLLKRSEIISLKQVGEDAHSQLRERRRRQRQHITLFNVSGAALALETTCITRMLDQPKVEPVTYATALLLGEVFLEKEAIPVVSMAQLVGLPRQSEKEKQAIVLSLATGRVVLLVNEILDVVHWLCDDSDLIKAEHDEQLAQLRFIHHLIPLNQLSSFNGGPMHGVSNFFIALDNELLTNCDELISIAASTRLLEAGQTNYSDDSSRPALGSDLEHVNSPQVLGYQAGIQLYTMLEQVREILPMAGLDLLYTDENKHQALLMFHMQAIPVFDLSYLMGQRVDNIKLEERVVLMTKVRAGFVGFIIDRLVSIDYLIWMRDSRSPVIQRAISNCLLSGDAFEACWHVCKTDRGDQDEHSFQYALDLAALGEMLIAETKPAITLAAS